jgi:hypothetical protein
MKAASMNVAIYLALAFAFAEPLLPSDLQLIVNLDGLRALNHSEAYRQRVKGYIFVPFRAVTCFAKVLELSHPNLVVLNLIHESEGDIEDLKNRFAQCHG